MNRQFKLAVLGDGGVGKTALSIMFTAGHFVEMYDPTIEDCYRKQAVVDGEVCLVEILDTAGQEEFSALRDQWIRESQGYVLVYSVTSRESYEQIAGIRSCISRVTDSDSASIILVANKCDLVDKRVVSEGEGRKLAQAIGATYIEASAKRRMGVDEAFAEGVRLIRRSREAADGGEGKKKKKTTSKRDACRIL